MFKPRCFLFLSIFFLALSVVGQETFPFNGIRDDRSKHFAFTHATIIPSPTDTIHNGVMIIKRGKIEAVGKDLSIPKGAIEVNLNGKYIYPSFIDIYSNYGMPQPKQVGKKKHKKRPQMLSDKQGAYSWNEALKPEFNAFEAFEVDTEAADKLRAYGFGAVQSLQKDGIARGTATLVALGEQRSNKVVLEEQTSAQYSFDKGVSSQAYPTSLMGAIALLRQTYLDAEWYEEAKDYPTVERNISLSAWNRIQSLPQMFAVKDMLSVLRADKVGDEFDVQYIIKGSGKEYQRLDAMKQTGAPFVIPLNFPQPFDVEDPYDALQVSLAQMKHWELAPSNPAHLARADIEFAITAADTKNKKKFWKNLRKAIKHGLSPQNALQALTTTPAHLLQADDKIGTLEEGKLANFLITTGNIFDKKEVILQNWVQGRLYKVNEFVDTDPRGTYRLTIEGEDEFEIKVKGKFHHPKAVYKINDTTKKKVHLKFEDDLVTIAFPWKADTSETIRLSGWKTSDTTWQGDGQLPNGEWVKWNAHKTAPFQSKKNNNKEDTPQTGQIIYPFTAYGWKELPEQEKILFKNATVWTNEAAGIIEEGNVLIEDGKIAAVGKDLEANGAEVVDASGLHLTCGIIDEHSHIAISRGVNEGSQFVTSEVSIEDVVNSKDINIYRQLAGGVTSMHLLHGSANPIGGQTELVKMRWGDLPEAMKFEDAAPFIKFALGENVKQSNWGDDFTIRYPQTRMGVEQTMYDAFTRALDYEAEWERYENMSRKEQENTVPPRKNLELEALLEILQEKRFITCHSYVQSELNMMMHMADSFGFTLNTFTHVLEGYKVADKMAEHGAGGSTFSDWWAYKFEVIDAIPHNAAIMQNTGVTTAINSDNAEMGRRLNQEAAKAIKYGSLSEEAAWKLVTLNPAKLLHVDDRVGSIRAGKDADIVLWTDNPLSVYAKVKQTYVDGRCLFDRQRSEKKHAWIQKERNRLIQKMIAAKENGAKTQKPKSDDQKLYHCETIGGYPK